MEKEYNSRREFLKTSTAVGTALTLSFYLPNATAKTLERLAGLAPASQSLNAFLKVSADDTVTVIIKHLEMGQGIHTSLPMILAEELGADWSKIKVETAPANDKLYANGLMGLQGTGGSSSIANSWTQLRQAGATAREMLTQAAAAQLQVPTSELKVELGQVIHAKSSRSLSFGALAEAASRLPVPSKVRLKSPSEYSIIGKSMPRLDNAEKTSGAAIFSMDMQRPRQLVVLLARPPRFGGILRSVHSVAALKIPGVLEVLKVPQGVAVVAENFWAAKKGREALKLVWDDSAAFTKSTADLQKQYRELLNQKGSLVKATGDVAKAQEVAKEKISVEFEFPYLAHAPMETLNCVIEVTKNRCEIWSGSQMPTVDQRTAASILGLKPENVQVHTLFAGGSFGRRATANADLVAEAAQVALAAKKKKSLVNRPLHLIWTREDDIRGGYYRPYFVHKVEAGLDSAKRISFWNHRIVGQSIMAGGPFAAAIKDGVDPTSVEGTADMPYDVSSMYVDLHSPTSPVPVLWLRAVGHTHTAFVVETLIDELAERAGRDPVEFRLGLLKSNPRHAAVLKLAAEKAEWKKPLPEGRARGVALHKSFNTIVAVVVEVSDDAGSPRVERAICALDCGTVVNPDNVKAQIEGGLGFGLAAALHGEITFDKGEVVQSNFHDYKVLRFNEMPLVEVYTVPSTAEPTGVGEPGVPVMAPAMANAFAKLTGKRLRKLPFKV